MQTLKIISLCLILCFTYAAEANRLGPLREALVMALNQSPTATSARAYVAGLLDTRVDSITSMINADLAEIAARYITERRTPDEIDLIELNIHSILAVGRIPDEVALSPFATHSRTLLGNQSQARVQGLGTWWRWDVENSPHGLDRMIYILVRNQIEASLVEAGRELPNTAGISATTFFITGLIRDGEVSLAEFLDGGLTVSATPPLQDPHRWTLFVEGQRIIYRFEPIAGNAGVQIYQ